MAPQNHDPHAPPTIKDRFLSRLTGTAAGAPRDRQPMTTQALLGVQGELAELCGRSQTPRFQAELRAELLGKRSPILGELLLLCGRALAAKTSASFADKIAVSPAACDEAAAQDGALFRLVKTAGDVHDLCEGAAAETAARAEEDAKSALAAAADFAADALADPARRIAVETTFAEASRLYDEARRREDTRALRKERRLRPLREALHQAETGTEELRLIDRYLGRSGEATHRDP